MSWFSQDRVKFPRSRGGALAGLFTYRADVTSWRRSELGRLTHALSHRASHCWIGRYFALFIIIIVTVIVVVVCCVAVTLLY